MPAIVEMPVITTLYTGLNTLLIIALAMYVVVLRYRHKVGIGDGGVPELLRAIRAHGNALEYVPLTLIMMLALELNAVADAHLHTIGAVLLIGRLLHAWGLVRTSGTSPGRFLGTLSTWGIFIYAAVLCVITAI